LILLLALAPAVGVMSAAMPSTAAAEIPPVTAADRVLGQANAPVTVVEYASFTCPHCAHWATTVLPEFKTRFIDTGRVKLVFRDLPTPPVAEATAAAMMGRCAAPGRFFAMAEAFFSGQAAFRATNSRAPWFAAVQAVSGRTVPEMWACMDDPAGRARLNADVEAALAAGVNTTPNFFVNGRALAGDPTIEVLSAAIAAAQTRR
jgi:protein-disulfide isomerase